MYMNGFHHVTNQSKRKVIIQLFKAYYCVTDIIFQILNDIPFHMFNWVLNNKP